MTALQELVLELEDIKTKSKTFQEMLFFDAVKALIHAKYLSKERKQIEGAIHYGWDFEGMTDDYMKEKYGFVPTAENLAECADEYYKETFENGNSKLLKETEI